MRNLQFYGGRGRKYGGAGRSRQFIMGRDPTKQAQLCKTFPSLAVLFYAPTWRRRENGRKPGRRRSVLLPRRRGHYSCRSGNIVYSSLLQSQYNKPNERNSELFFRPVQSGACALVPTTLVNRVIFFNMWVLLMRIFRTMDSPMVVNC